MTTRKTFGEIIFDFLNLLFLGALSLIFIYPLIYVIFASFSDPVRLSQHTGILWKPLGFSLAGYKLVLTTSSIGIGYLNTIFYVVAGTLLNILLSSLGAYVLSRKNLYIRRPMSLAIVFTMYFSGGLIPFFLAVKGYGLYDSRMALILPVAINTWNLIIMRTAFSQVPDGLEEAARIDGANDFVILFRIILPVVKSTIAVMVLFYAVQQWNAWFNAMVFLRDRSKFPLQLFLREILLSASTIDVTKSAGDSLTDVFAYSLIKYCTIVVTTLPILCIYPFLQKYFTKGVMIGSLKE
jgi:putative aldouronate transport system permease protein